MQPLSIIPHPCEQGGIAQLGERLHGMQEVSGSIPLISTRIIVLVTTFIT